MKYITVEEAAKASGLHRTTIIRKAQDGIIDFSRFGCAYMIGKQSFYRWLTAYRKAKGVEQC